MASREKYLWEIGVENLQAEYERQRPMVAAQFDQNYRKLVETFRLVGRTSLKDLELCRALARRM